jgi:hypothetical protein
MSFAYYEGTMDFIVTTPALIISLVASGSISAGQGVTWSVQNDATVYVPTTAQGSTQCAGVCLATVSTGQFAPVLVWGYAKNLTFIGTVNPGNLITLSGSAGGFTALAAGSYVTGSVYAAGTCVSGSAAGKTSALISCLK